MKIRTGFVSNSSSSSFCAIGNVIPEDQIYSGKYKRKKGENIVMIGGYTDDGSMVIDLTDEHLEILSNWVSIPACKGCVTFLSNAKVFSESDGARLGEVDHNARVYTGSCTINGLSDEEFKQAYVEGKDSWVSFR